MVLWAGLVKRVGGASNGEDGPHGLNSISLPRAVVRGGCVVLLIALHSHHSL